MLDSVTKRRIDTCRDILVGKIPDPKSQVEQITIALIYKFMDDMDLESEELGGERKFFTGEFERYSWGKLVAAGTSGQDMPNTYGEALQRMTENEKLPALFRDIFRNAYLPYRDPETLRSFLREIDGFTYDHSERLGDAFEYLLSVLGSQGDAGQFRTPRHIIDFMVALIDPKKDEVILDPACGTAGFLISSYKHILKANSSEIEDDANGDGESAVERPIESPLRFAGDLLTPEDRQRLARNIKGYDISPDMVRLSLVNLYLHGFANPRVEEYDTLTSEDKWSEMADVILANPPFMSPRGGIQPHNRFSIAATRSEVLFVDYIAEHLTPKGRAAVIVPEGVIFQSGNAYKTLRKVLVENFLVAVVSLPAGVFNPYSGVKTSILIFDRAAARASDTVGFFKIANDGFNLGAQRRPVSGSELAGVSAEIAEYRAHEGEAAWEGQFGRAIAKAEIAASGDYNLSGARYAESTAAATRWPLVSVGSVCEFQSGSRQKGGAVQAGVPSIGGEQINELGKIRFEKMKYVTDEHFRSMSKGILRRGDVLIVKDGATTGKTGYFDHEMEAAVNEHVFILRANESIHPLCLYHVIRSPAFQEGLRPFIKGIIGGISLEVRDLKIPLPPLDIQREIVAEIEGYQKVIDGARAVLENYRPHIPIAPERPLESLNEVAAFQEGPGILAKDFRDKGVPLVRLSGLQRGRVTLTGCNYLDPVMVESKWSHFRLVPGDLAITTSASFGNAALVDHEAEGAVFYTGIIRFSPKAQSLDHGYLRSFLNSSNFLDQADSMATGAVIKHFGPTHLRQMTIPLPPLEVQQAIVAELEAERALVEANRQLVARMEAKIEATIARVWGAAAEEDGELDAAA